MCVGSENTFLKTRLSALMTLFCIMCWSLAFCICKIPQFTQNSVSPFHDHWPMIKGPPVLLLQNRSDHNDFASRCSDLVGNRKHARNEQLEKIPQKQLLKRSLRAKRKGRILHYSINHPLTTRDNVQWSLGNEFD